MRVIKEKLIKECITLKSMPEKYNEKYEFTSNITTYEIKKILESDEKLNYEIVNQVINKNMKVVALIIQKGEANIYVPCYPSSINILLPTTTFENTDVILQPYEQTVELLRELFNVSDKKILSEPKYKVVNENMIVGIITITNQFIPIIPEAYISPPAGFKGEQDGLKVFDGNTSYYSDYLENESGKNGERNMEREKVVKKIKLESSFYNIFRNTIRIVLNNNKESREYLRLLLEDKRVKYNEKLFLIRDRLKTILENYVDFVDYSSLLENIENINEIIKCFGLNKKDCNSKRCCTFSSPTGTCKLLLPNTNLINESNNEETYYVKIADEMIRYRKIRNFFFDREVFLYFSEVHYNLNEDEIILLENILFNQYLKNIVPLVRSELVQTNKIYDIVKPQTSVEYSNKYKLEGSDMVVNKCLLYEGEEGPNLKVGQQWRKLGLGRWKDHGDFNFLRVKDEKGCIYDLLSLIIKDHTNKNVSKATLMRELQNFYRSNWESNGEKIKEIFKTQGKKDILEQLKRNGIQINDVIYYENYNLTLIDIFIIALKYNLPLLVFASTSIPDFATKTKLFIHDKNDSSFYLLKIGKMKGNNISPIFGILTYKNRLKISSSELGKAKNELLKNGSVKTFDEYMDKYTKMKAFVDRGKKLKKKKGKRKLKSSVSSKK
jgi:hypothetical protein